MSRAELIYPLEKCMERELAKIEGDPCNSKILTRYYKVRSSQVKIATIIAEFVRLNEMSRILAKKFEDVTVQDIEDLIFKIDSKKNADNTKNKYRKVLKAFYRWMKGCSPREYPSEVRWITLKKVPLVTVTPQDLISFDECIRISEFSGNLRDKALIQCKLDAGCRIGEILTPKIGEVEFNENGAIIYTDGKTGNQPIILTWSAKILAVWLNNHPFKNNPDAPLWPVSSCNKPRYLSYAAARAAFINCTRRAGLKKRIWFHLLKHVSSTEDSAKGMPDSKVHATEIHGLEKE
ncbi:MAG: tyrosine-type recombinase/integrase [Candidatus Nitrosotenuis sp.]